MGIKEYTEHIDKFYDDVISKDKTYNIDRETFRKLIMSYEKYVFQKEDYDRIEYLCKHPQI